MNKDYLTILGANVPFYPKDLTNDKVTAHCNYLWKMSDRTSFIYYWYWRNYLYLGYNYGWVLILHCTLKASNLHGESSVFRRILNAFQDKLTKINDYKNECWILDGLVGNLLQADISRRIESISIGDITDVRDITTAEILILPITLKPSSWNLSVTTFLWDVWQWVDI